MKVIIMTDLEGISLVDSIDMIPEENDGYKFACQRLMADVNAAVQGAVDAGADEIIVFDGHGRGNPAEVRETGCNLGQPGLHHFLYCGDQPSSEKEPRDRESGSRQRVCAILRPGGSACAAADS